jgi:hypothetical protein
MTWQSFHSEVSIAFTTVEALEAALPLQDYRREPIPWVATSLAGKVFRLAVTICRSGRL